MPIKNLKKKSGVSVEILSEGAVREGLTLEEYICQVGLPDNPTFQILI
ncbi:hypothetical protein IPN41_00570 [Candidatus Falkowbacteria bacterium]|nr:MAG: hypothetical protein IPN41_00570 [Candidatus Falkowbacteria bacterium]